MATAEGESSREPPSSPVSLSRVEPHWFGVTPPMPPIVPEPGPQE